MLLSRRRARFPLLGVVVSALVLAGCQGSEPAPEGGPRYVALGDSAVAGAGINRSVEKPCLRSDHNYPSLVADALDVGDFVDVSCPGATTDDVLYGQTQPDGEPTPPQIEEVTKDTDVVTISIGGNDGQYVPDLFVGCYVPPANTSQACRAAIAKVTPLLPQIKTGVVGVIEEVRKRAPDAQVVLVTYLRIAPERGRCDEIALDPADQRAAADAEQALADTMQEAAEEAGADVLPMRQASEGHDACAGDDEAWTNQITVAPGDGTFLHPRAIGAEAVAKALEPVVRARLTTR